MKNSLNRSMKRLFVGKLEIKDNFLDIKPGNQRELNLNIGQGPDTVAAIQHFNPSEPARKFYRLSTSVKR